ncbi:MAG: nucleotide excision repair endonuclease [Bdellovibrionaceae bacterium]|nr:nucleotide excision repair endonuclease [Bdellovibrionales bacterium]MCB9083533.1 nucleotide excision repair endonuclease [Pseudobdellovibrionaceae bacterium]
MEPQQLESRQPAPKQHTLIDIESGFRRRFGLEFFRRIPSEPGVYFLKDRTRQILYVGKSKNLRQRLTSYRYLHKREGARKWRRLLEQVYAVDWSVTANPKDAELLENRLLRELKPPFNTMNTRPEGYYYWGVAWFDSNLSLLLRTQQSEVARHRVFGAFRGRQLCQRAQTALMRLFHWTLLPGAPLPQPLNRPLALSMEKLEWKGSPLPEGIRGFWAFLLENYLSGRDDSLISTFSDHLKRTENLFSEAFYLRWLEEDLETLKQFFRLGPQRIFQARQELRLGDGPIAQDQVDDLYTHLAHSEFQQITGDRSHATDWHPQ